MEAYFSAVELALGKEFRLYVGHYPDQIAYYRKLYYDYQLSEESFKDDLEEPLRLSEEEKPSKEWEERIKNSIANKFQIRVGLSFN